MTCFISLTDYHGGHVGVPQRSTNMADPYCLVNNILENWFGYNLILTNTTEPEIILVSVYMYLAFNSLLHVSAWMSFVDVNTFYFLDENQALVQFNASLAFNISFSLNLSFGRQAGYHVRK